METIWKASISDRYFCIVDRIDDHHGQLRLFNVYTYERLLDHPVYLTYGAHPAEATDIEDWMSEVQSTLTRIETRNRTLD